MKKVVIRSENVNPVVLYDESLTSIEEYSLQLSKELKAKEEVVLVATSGSVVIKPSRVVSITVTEYTRKKETNNSNDKEQTNKETGDIITDEE